MERYRKNFSDHSYFVAMAGSGRYYHNNAQNAYAGKELRYQLDKNDINHTWFFELLRSNRDLQINVSPDTHLGVVKVWINVLLRDGDTPVGIVGTGLDLGDFLANVIEEGTPGITSLFVDHTGAIQLHRDQSLIDFASISRGKDKKTPKSLELLLGHPEDVQAVRQAMHTVEEKPQTVATTFVQVNGRRHMAGIAYLPEIDWYEVTLLDLDVLLPPHYFYGILGVYIFTVLVALVFFNLVLNRLVLSPLSSLDQAMARVASGEDPSSQLPHQGAGEVQRLIRHFSKMTASVLQARRELESKVEERTAALERIAKIDPLTELFNRRGMGERLQSELDRAQREYTHMGLLWLDVDWFKSINDTYGHAIGDEALKLVARTLKELIRPYDVAARWGGDEFVVLLQTATQETLNTLGERIVQAVAAATGLNDAQGHPIRLSISVGGYLAQQGEGLDRLLQNADQALYAAKAAGRGCYRSLPA